MPLVFKPLADPRILSSISQTRSCASAVRPLWRGYSHISKDLILEVEAENSYAWVITIKGSSDEAIGLIHFLYQEKKKQGNSGFWISENFQGKGLMTEAISAVNDFVFDVLKIEKFTVVNAQSNAGLQRVKEKTGAIYIGLQDSPHHNGDMKSELNQLNKTHK